MPESLGFDDCSFEIESQQIFYGDSDCRKFEVDYLKTFGGASSSSSVAGLPSQKQQCIFAVCCGAYVCSCGCNVQCLSAVVCGEGYLTVVVAAIVLGCIARCVGTDTCKSDAAEKNLYSTRPQPHIIVLSQF